MDSTKDAMCYILGCMAAGNPSGLSGSAERITDAIGSAKRIFILSAEQVAHLKSLFNVVKK